MTPSAPRSGPRGPGRGGRARPVQPSTCPLTRASGPPAHGGHDEAVAATGDGIGAEEHAAPPGLRASAARGRPWGRRPGPATRAASAEPRTASTAADEGGLVGDVEDRLEHAGHRGGGAVLARRRGAHDDGAGPGGRDESPGLAGAVFVKVGPRRGEDHAGEGGQSSLAGLGEVGRLRPGPGGIGGGSVVERDERVPEGQVLGGHGSHLAGGP